MSKIGIRIHPDSRQDSTKIPDSHWLAPIVVAAFTEERYELGAALARLCVQAYRVERDSAPMPARPEVPSVPAESDATASTAVYPVIPSTRCIALIGGPGKEHECHSVLYWREADSVSEAGWEHMDGITDHQPMPARSYGLGQ